MRWFVPLVALWTLACMSGSEPVDETPEEVPADGGDEDNDERKPSKEKPSPTKGKPVALESVVATSNRSKVGALFDLDESTRWAPDGDPAEEGVLVRFSKPTYLKEFEAISCDGEDASIQLYANGSVVKGKINDEVRSVFVRIKGADTGCLTEIRFEGRDGLLAPEVPSAVKGRVKASSTLKPEAAYLPSYAFDGRTQFAWVEGDKGLGKGESLAVDFDKSVSVSAIEVWNGYQRSDDHFKKNGRVGSFELLVDGKKAQVLKLKDKSGSQKIKLDKTAKGKEFELKIRDVVAGSKYEDTVVSEVRFHGSDGPFMVEDKGVEDAEKKLRKELSGTALEKVVGRKFESNCREASIKFRKDHSFVSYDKDGKRREVFDGAWVPTETGKQSEVKLYGRRNVVASVFTPYGDQDERNTTKVSGGTLKITRVEDMGKDRFKALVKKHKKGPASDTVKCLFEKDSMGDAYKILLGRGAIWIEGAGLVDLMIQ